MSAIPVVVQSCMPQGYPWGMPENFVPEGFNLGPQVTPVVQTTVTPAPHMVHVTIVSPPSVNVAPFVNDEHGSPFRGNCP